MVEIVEVHEDGSETVLSPCARTPQRTRQRESSSIPKRIGCKLPSPKVLDLSIPHAPVAVVELLSRGRNGLVRSKARGTHAVSDSAMRDVGVGAAARPDHDMVDMDAPKRSRARTCSDMEDDDIDVDMDSPTKKARAPLGAGRDLRVRKRVRPSDIENVESNFGRLHIKMRSR